MAKLVIGLDGGGTKTLGILVTSKGTIMARETGESSNIQAIGADKLGQTLRALVEKLAAAAGVPVNEIDHLYAGLAGAGRPADREAISKIITESGLAKNHTVDTDASAALAGAFAGGPGIIVISGTGAICFGKDAAGTLFRCGGWGYLLGDEGSGYYIGQQALIAALKDFDGRGPKTILRELLENRYGLTTIDMIISQIYSGKIDRTEIASNAPFVFEACERADPAARQVIESAGREIGKQVAATANRMGCAQGEVVVALIGSVFKQRDILIPFMEEEAKKVVSKVTFIDPRFEPAIGSAILGLAKEKVVITDAVLSELGKSFPG